MIKLLICSFAGLIIGNCLFGMIGSIAECLGDSDSNTRMK